MAIRRGAALNSTDRGAIHSVFKKVYKAERINPAFSKIANMIIPGSGQIYSGDFKNGLNLTLLLSLLGLLAVNTGVNYSFMDAVITIMPWYQRYYMGGYTKAEQIGIKRKDQKQEQLKSELLTLIASTKN